MRDLRDPRWMYVKAALLLGIGVLAFALLLLEHPLPARIALQLVMIWGFCRAYYFAFYVVEHYIDGTRRYAGLVDFIRHLASRRRADENAHTGRKPAGPGELP